MFDLKKYRDAKDPLDSQDKTLRNDVISTDAMKNIASIGETTSKMFLDPELQYVNVDIVGRIMSNHWRNKCKISKPDSNIEEIYGYGIKSNAIGGKLIGAGTSGFMIFYVPLLNHTNFTENMGELDLVRVPFKFDFEGLKTECHTSN